MALLLDSELTDPEFKTFWGYEAKKVADVALSATAVAAIATIPAVFLHTSKYESLHVVGDAMSLVIWLVFLIETLLMIRLHHGWGGEWLKTHKLQLVVIVLANPILVWAIGRFETLELATLLPLPSFIQSAKLMKVFKLSKVLKFLHLGEVKSKARATLSHVRWLLNSILLSVGLLVLGIVGAVLEGGAATPIHALDVWFEVRHSMVSSAPEAFLATLPLVMIVVGATAWRKRSLVER